MHRPALLFLVLIISLSAGCQAKQAELNGPRSHGGIAVRGDWTIEVRNADGTVAETVKFQNDLHPYGESLLAQLLIGHESGASVKDTWIDFQFGEGGAKADCKGHEPVASMEKGTMKAQVDLVDNTKLRWSASCILNDDEMADDFYSVAVAKVYTRLKLNGHISVKAPYDTESFSTDNVLFTTRTLSGVNATESQTIQAIVEISFSTKSP